MKEQNKIKLVKNLKITGKTFQLITPYVIAGTLSTCLFVNIERNIVDIKDKMIIDSISNIAFIMLELGVFGIRTKFSSFDYKEDINKIKNKYHK